MRWIVGPSGARNLLTTRELALASLVARGQTKGQVGKYLVIAESVYGTLLRV